MNDFIKEQVLASLSRGGGKYVHGMSEGAIHREMKSSVGYSCPVSDIRTILVRLSTEGVVNVVTFVHVSFYSLNPTGVPCPLDEDVARHCSQT